MKHTMPPILEEPVAWLIARLDAAPRRWMIGLAGVPGSGKTTLAARLAEDVNARTAPETLVALGMDGFHLTKAELRQFPDPDLAFARRGAPWTFDVPALQRRLQTLRDAAGRADVPWPGFEHAVGDPVEAAYGVPAATRLVLVEGLYLLHQADGWGTICHSFDTRWYLDTPLDLSLDRLAARHMRVWGMTRAEAEHRIATNDRPNALVVRQSRASADWLLTL